MKYWKKLIFVFAFPSLVVETFPQQQKQQQFDFYNPSGHQTTASKSNQVKNNDLIIKTDGRPIGEYNPIDGLIIAQSYCTSIMTGYDDINAIQAKLIKSAAAQNVTVFFVFRSDQLGNCLSQLELFLPLKLTPENYPNVILLPFNPYLYEARPSTFIPSIWTRDYMPMWLQRKSGQVANGQELAVVTLANGNEFFERTFVHEYTQQRSNIYRKTELQTTGLKNEGGNFVANDAGLCISSTSVLVKNEKSESTMREVYSAFYGCIETIFIEVFPYDFVRHSDMVVSFATSNVILVGVYNSTDVDKITATISENNFKLIASNKFVKEKKYEVVKVPMPTYCPTGFINCLEYLTTFCAFDKTEDDSAECSQISLSKCSPRTFGRAAKCAKVYIDQNLPSYLNFFHLNNDLHVPVFEKNKKYEDEALKIIKSKIKKNIIKHVADDLAMDGGGIHCVVKEIPRGKLFKKT